MTFTGDFELRRFNIIWTVQDAASPSDDVRVCTLHIAKQFGTFDDVTDETWDAADYSSVDAKISTFISSLAAYTSNKYTWDRLTAYRVGPNVEPPQPKVYDADKNVVGTVSSAPLPPQVAVSVTEIAGSKRYWGRFYLPGWTTASVSAYGRLSSTEAGLLADMVDTLYTSLDTADLHPVVYRQALPARTTKAGTALPARAASAYNVTKVQVDDVLDVIRRRRYKHATVKAARDI